MTSLTSHVIHLNNMAAKELANGRYPEAHLLQRSSLMKLEELYHAREESGTAANTSAADKRMGENPRRQQSRSLETCSSQEFASLRDLDQECCGVFRRSILLPEDEENLSVLTAVVLFNLALCEHVMGLLNGITRHLHAALKMYRLSYQIIQDNRDSVSFCDLLVLAVINNIAECASQNMEAMMAKQWFDFLGRILGVDRPEIQNMTTLGEKDYSFFFTNAVVQHGSVLLSAPAA